MEWIFNEMIQTLQYRCLLTLIVVVNTSHDAPRQPLEVPYRKWHSPQCSPKLPIIVSNAVTMGLCLSNRWRI